MSTDLERHRDHCRAMAGAEHVESCGVGAAGGRGGRVNCRWAGSTEPRLLRTHRRDCESSGCPGCEPCPERHCQVCGREHVTAEGRGNDETCTECLSVVREDAKLIERMSGFLMFEAVAKGVHSEAASLAGPSQNTPDRFEAFGYRRMSAIMGRIPAMEADDDRHPLFVLGTWEMAVREHYGQEADGETTITIPAARAYLDGHLHRLAHDPEFAFSDLARDLRVCRGHLEDVLHDGVRDETGAPCPMCGRANLVKDYGTKVDDEVRWKCPRDACGEWYSEPDYEAKVNAVYIQSADRLTARQMREAYRVPEGSTRAWATKGLIRRRGKDHHGLTLYDVADTLKLRDRQVVEPAGTEGVA